MTDFRTSPETETVPLPARMRDFIKSGITQFKEHELREIVAVFCRLPGIAPRPELAPTPDLPVVMRALTAEEDRMMRDALMSSVGHITYLEPVHHWLPIETAPKDGSAIDLWCINISHGSTGAVRAADMWWDEEVDRWVERHGNILEQKWRPTHWMPIPQGPDTSTDRACK